MNKIIVVKLSGLITKYHTELKKFSHQKNEYALFMFDQAMYYKPLLTFILPDLKIQLATNPSKDVKMYLEYILPKYRVAIEQELNTVKKVGNEFIKKMSADLIKDFNTLLIAYGKTDKNLKLHFLNQCIKNRHAAIKMLVENDPELALKTIANLSSPRLQYYFINKLEPKITLGLTDFLNECDLQRTFIVLNDYFFYPEELDPRSYYEQWKGDPAIHIKFCKIVMTKYYEEAKEFLKEKYYFEKKYGRILYKK